MFAYPYTAEELRERRQAELERRNGSEGGGTFLGFIGGVVGVIAAGVWFFATAVALERVLGFEVAPGIVLLVALLAGTAIVLFVGAAADAVSAAVRRILGRRSGGGATSSG